jgi:hypothetical protein
MMSRGNMGKQIMTAPGKAAGRGSAKGQSMRGFGCGGKVKKYSKGGTVVGRGDGCAQKGKTKCRIY